MQRSRPVPESLHARHPAPGPGCALLHRRLRRRQQCWTPPMVWGPGLGPGADLEGRRPFPDDNPWNAPWTGRHDPASDAVITRMGGDRRAACDFGANWNGWYLRHPVRRHGLDRPAVPVTFTYDDESDAGPYPIPDGAPIEGGSRSKGDRHILVVMATPGCCTNCSRRTQGRWKAGLRRRVRPGQQRPPPGRLDQRRRCGTADLPRAGSLRRSGGAGRDPPRAALHGGPDPARLRGAGPALREQRHRSRACHQWGCECDSRHRSTRRDMHPHSPR